MNDEKDLSASTVGAEENHVAAELAALKERYSYLLADFENHRRREERERVQRTISFQSGVMLDLLGLVDNFERALKDVATANVADLQARLAGFELIHKSLLKILEKYGVTEITQVTTFDPELHEVLVQVPQEGKESGAIVDVLQKGYLLKGSVLRPAQVSVVA